MTIYLGSTTNLGREMQKSAMEGKVADRVCLKELATIVPTAA